MTAFSSKSRVSAPTLALQGVATGPNGRSLVHVETLEMAGPGWVGIIGANGSGKTTLLKALSGRLPLLAGRIVLNNEEQGVSRTALAQRVGFMPDASCMPSDLTGQTVSELVAAQTDEEGETQLLVTLRAALDLERFWARPVGHYSAGMKQRLALYCAFVGGQRIVLLDEPFNWLDPVSLFDLKQVLREMAQSDYLLITTLHEPMVLLTSCSYGVLLDGGRVRMTLSQADLHCFSDDPTGFERYVVSALRVVSQRMERAVNV